MFVAASAYPAWRHAALSLRTSQAIEEIEKKDFDAALRSLELSARLAPTDPLVAFRKAVCYRRTGKVAEFEQEIQAAKRLGHPNAAIERQRLLMRVQLGRFDKDEPALREALSASLTDDEALELYEALAQGYWANDQVSDALNCLDFWIKWRPYDPDPRLMKVDIHLTRRESVPAERELRDILEFAPDHALTQSMLAGLMVERGRVDEAERHFRRCLELNYKTDRVLFGLAECALSLARPEEAEQWLNQIEFKTVAEPEFRANVFKRHADIALLRGDRTQAVQWLEKGLQAWPHSGAIHHAIARELNALGQRKAAQEHFEKGRKLAESGEKISELRRVIRTDPRNPEPRWEIGKLLEESGISQDAADWWHSAVRCDPNHLPAQSALASFYAKQGDAKSAELHRLLAGRAAATTFGRGWSGVDYAKLDEVKLAQKALNETGAWQAHAVLLQAAVLIAEKQPDAALAKAEPLFAHPQLRGKALALAAEAMMTQDKPLEAESLLLDALKHEPNLLLAIRWLSIIYYDLGAMSHAVFYLERVANLDPTDFRPVRLLGLINKDFERFQEAAACYQQTLSRNPPPAPREEVLLELAECQWSTRDYSAALETLAQAAFTAEREELRADCLYSLGRRDEAIAVARRVLELSPKSFKALLLLGDAALLEKDNAKAVELLSRAAEGNVFDFDVHHKLSQALARTGKAEESERAAARAEELKSLRQHFSMLHEQAFEKPHDALLRYELAKTAKKLGRDDLAEVWTKAAQGIERSAASPPPPRAEKSVIEKAANAHSSADS